MDLCNYCLNIVIFLVIVVSRTTRASRINKVNIERLLLKGGPKNYEGLLEITSQEHSFNLCADEDKRYTSITNLTCKRLDHVYFGTVYDDNVFNASLSVKIAQIGQKGCSEKTDVLTCDVEFVENCTKLISMCCSSDNAPKLTDTCSANWTTAASRNRHTYYIKPSIYQIVYYAGSNNQNTEVKLSWTRYAFKGSGICEENITMTNDNSDILKCANNCLDEYMNTTGVDEGKDDKVCNCEGNITHQCSSMALNLTQRKDDRIVFCVAGSIQDGTPKLEALDCSKYLPTMYFDQSTVPAKPTTKTTTSTKTTTYQLTTNTTTPETQDDKHGANHDTDGDENSERKRSDIDTVSIITIIMIVIGIFVCVIVLLLIKARRNTSQQKRTSSDSRYFNNAGGRGNDQEEYVLINEMEMTSSISEFRRPSLPKRGPNNSSEDSKRYSHVMVVAADEYSTPKDSLQAHETDLFDVYSHTYDDPIRLGLKRDTNEKVETSSTKIPNSSCIINSKVIDNKVEQSTNVEVCESDKTVEVDADESTNINSTGDDNKVDNDCEILEKNVVDNTDTCTDIADNHLDQSANTSDDNVGNT